MSRKQPIYLIHQDGVDPASIFAVEDGVRKILDVAGASSDAPIRNFGAWRHPQWRDGSALRKYHSVDWYVAEGRRTGRERLDGIQLNISMMLWHLLHEPWRQPPHQNHYDIAIVREDLWAGSSSNNFVLGAALGDALILSTKRLHSIPNPTTRVECLQTLTMHELGHVFGLIPSNRTDNVEESLGKHCTNRCIMRQGLRVPDDWIRLTRDRLLYGPFCTTCENDLRKNFCA